MKPSFAQLLDALTKVAAKDLAARQRVEVFPRKDGKILAGLFDQQGVGVYGGGVDEGETIEEAARREMLEEAGYNVENLRPIDVAPYRRPWPKELSEKQQARAKRYPGGTETHAYTGNIVGAPVRSEEDHSGWLKDVDFRTLQELRKIQQGAIAGASPENADLAQYRMQVLEALQRMQQEKVSAAKDPARWDDPVIFAPHAKMTKQDLFDYYANRAVKRRILDAVGKTETVIRQSFDPQNMILRRKDGRGKLIRLGKEYDRWNDMRMSEVHPTFGSKVDFVLADIDPQAKVPWNKAKGITETVAKTMASHPDIKNVEVQFSGGRGFYVKGFTRNEMPVDRARSLTQEILRGVAARPDITFGVAEADQIRLDTSPLKRRGSVRAPYSLNATTGLVSAPVKIEDLPDVQKEDFTVDKILGSIVRRATKRASAEFAPGIPKSRKIETLPHFRRPRDWTMVVQTHDAKRAGKHWDLRLVDPKTEMAHSFAVPKGRFPGSKDRMLLAIQQPTHTANYALNFEGEIPAGTYGAGEVKQELKENVRVLKSSDNKLQFERPDGGRYTLFRTRDSNWGIIRND